MIITATIVTATKPGVALGDGSGSGSGSGESSGFHKLAMRFQKKSDSFMNNSEKKGYK